MKKEMMVKILNENKINVKNIKALNSCTFVIDFFSTVSEMTFTNAHAILHFENDTIVIRDCENNFLQDVVVPNLKKDYYWGEVNQDFEECFPPLNNSEVDELLAETDNLLLEHHTSYVSSSDPEPTFFIDDNNNYVCVYKNYNIVSDNKFNINFNFTMPEFTIKKINNFFESDYETTIITSTQLNSFQTFEKIMKNLIEKYEKEFDTLENLCYLDI